jgi:hypothetical protein
MRNPVRPAAAGGYTAELRQKYAHTGHEQLDALGLLLPDSRQLPGLSPVIQESWRRSAQLRANPDNPEAPLRWTVRNWKSTGASIP